MSIDVSVLEDLEGKDEGRGEGEKCCSKEPFDVRVHSYIELIKLH